jgi:propanol-preferring alcohol dehydrogenase
LKAMLLKQVVDLSHNQSPLELVDLSVPEPGNDEVLLRVSACGVCHTELDEIEGRTPPPRFPVIPGHQVVGFVERAGKEVDNLKPGDRVGVAWIFSACGECQYCQSGNENLCRNFQATGRDANGGYAEYMTVSSKFTYRIPEIFSDVEAAPHLCAGAVGYRALRLAGVMNGQSLGLSGFGASNHLVLKLARFQYPNTQIYVFSRSQPEQEFARELGAVWAGGFDDTPPVLLDRIIDATPVWKPIVVSLENLAPGGRLVINAIRKEDIDKDYLSRIDFQTHMWLEKEIKSVANVSRRDAREFLELAAQIPILPEVQEFKLEDANTALWELKNRKIRGAKVLKISE